MEGVITNKTVPYSTALAMLHASSAYLNLRFDLTNTTPVKVDNCGSHIIKLCDDAELQLVTNAILEWETCSRTYTATSDINPLIEPPPFVITLVNDLTTGKVVAIEVQVHREFVGATNDFILYGVIETVTVMLGRGRIYTAMAKPHP